MIEDEGWWWWWWWGGGWGFGSSKTKIRYEHKSEGSHNLVTISFLIIVFAEK